MSLQVAEFSGRDTCQAQGSSNNLTGDGVRAPHELIRFAERFRAVLEARCRAPKHVASRYQHCLLIIERAGVASPGDLTEERVELALGSLRRAGRSARTYNHYMTSFRQFCRWMMRNGLLATDPTVAIGKLCEDADRRHKRVNFSDAELTALFRATLAGQAWRGVSPLDRCALYRAAACTGLRQSTLGALTVGQFSLSVDAPFVKIFAHQEKSRKDRVVPIRSDDALWLGSYFGTRSPHVKAFLLPKWNFRRMFQRDVKAAGIRYCEEEPMGKGRPRRSAVHDFHSLRHTYGTRLALANVPLKVAQVLMGHSTPDLTAKVYSHVRQEDQSAFLALTAPLDCPSVPNG